MKNLVNAIGNRERLFVIAKVLVGDAPLSPGESAILGLLTTTEGLHADCIGQSLVEEVRAAITAGDDPLGTAYSSFRSRISRRAEGITLTPAHMVKKMIELGAAQGEPSRVVDPGAGTGRFTLAAAERFASALIYSVEKNPEVALILRANLAVKGLSHRVEVKVGDYRDITLPSVAGPTLFIGNPPYVRHHEIEKQWKQWYAEAFASLGIRASGLAGLHLHFFLKTLLLASPGDMGCFITAAEWLDVAYGHALRQILAHNLGGAAIYLINKSVPVFGDALTSTAVTCFAVGGASDGMEFHEMDISEDTVDTRKITSLTSPAAAATARWSVLVREIPQRAVGMVELGDYFKVQRGQVTGMNEVWIAGRHAAGLPESVLFPTVTRAQELIGLPSHRLDYDLFLRKAIDLPADLSIFSVEERTRIQRFLEWVKVMGGDQTYIARHRSPWWHVNLKPPAPILMTYMGRRPPVFKLNSCGARHINIAHGLYPRDTFAESDLDLLISWLNCNVSTIFGRTYAGGLTKFEPGEAMRLPVPTFEELREIGRQAA